MLASGSKTAAQPQMQEQAPLRASRLGSFQQTPAEDREITDRLLTIDSDRRQLANAAHGQTIAFAQQQSSRASWPDECFAGPRGRAAAS
jgi:hypothetical protein